jgi:hypothetical protein
LLKSAKYQALIVVKPPVACFLQANCPGAPTPAFLTANAILKMTYAVEELLKCIGVE